MKIKTMYNLGVLRDHLQDGHGPSVWNHCNSEQLFKTVSRRQIKKLHSYIIRFNVIVAPERTTK